MLGSVRRSCPTDSPPHAAPCPQLSASPWLQSPHPLCHSPCPVGSGGRGALNYSVPSRTGGRGCDGGWGASPRRWSVGVHPRLSVAVFLHLILPSQGATHSNFNQDHVQSARHFTLPREALFLCPSEQTRSESGQGPVQNSGFNSEVSTGLSPRSQAPDGRDPDGVTESTRDLSYS